MHLLPCNLLTSNVIVVAFQTPYMTNLFTEDPINLAF